MVADHIIFKAEAFKMCSFHKTPICTPPPCPPTGHLPKKKLRSDHLVVGAQGGGLATALTGGPVNGKDHKGKEGLKTFINNKKERAFFKKKNRGLGLRGWRSHFF